MAARPSGARFIEHAKIAWQKNVAKEVGCAGRTGGRVNLDVQALCRFDPGGEDDAQDDSERQDRRQSGRARDRQRISPSARESTLPPAAHLVESDSHEWTGSNPFRLA